ncbi:hypothetical protein TcasGA2_TC008075 [Tribolium castaneum]|uniref:Uncharacterized protein n=1 Tax=Tribolium castaneum TaxID=7070 RepID=D1ZZN6_TRICA|nr:hypothetical protein TcasGA2_TC008075 [Tribolium castaneum]
MFGVGSCTDRVADELMEYQRVVTIDKRRSMRRLNISAIVEPHPCLPFRAAYAMHKTVAVVLRIFSLVTSLRVFFVTRKILKKVSSLCSAHFRAMCSSISYSSHGPLSIRASVVDIALSQPFALFHVLSNYNRMSSFRFFDKFQKQTLKLR